MTLWKICCIFYYTKWKKKLELNKARSRQEYILKSRQGRKPAWIIGSRVKSHWQSQNKMNNTFYRTTGLPKYFKSFQLFRALFPFHYQLKRRDRFSFVISYPNNCGFDDNYIFGIVGGFTVTTNLEPWPKLLYFACNRDIYI